MGKVNEWCSLKASRSEYLKLKSQTESFFFAPTPVSQGKLLSSFLREGGYFNVIFKEILFQTLLILSGTLPKQAIYFKFIETPAAHFVAVVF